MSIITCPNCGAGLDNVEEMVEQVMARSEEFEQLHDELDQRIGRLHGESEAARAEVDSIRRETIAKLDEYEARLKGRIVSHLARVESTEKRAKVFTATGAAAFAAAAVTAVWIATRHR